MKLSKRISQHTEKTHIFTTKAGNQTTRDEQAKHAKVSKPVNKMNEEAKKAGNTESYSIRLNGEVWKFVKTESGRWERDSYWKFMPSILDLGNEISTPEPYLAPPAPQEESG